MKYDIVALWSGGLDSSLAIKILTAQDLKVLAVKFVTLFMSGKMTWRASLEYNPQLECDVLIIPLIRGYNELIKNPAFGYGKNINPCIDCKIFFLKRAKRIMKAVNAKGIATGEVLGQRPMSQNKQALQTIEMKSGLEGKIIRPLTARNLPQTELEQSGCSTAKGIVDREQLLALRGRSRKETMWWASEYGLHEYKTPAGGCLLTDPGFSARLTEAFQHNEDSVKELEALKFGRHFRLPDGTKLIVSRDDYESQYLRAILKSWLRIEPAFIPGRNSFLRLPYKTEEDLELSIKIALRYNARGNENIKLTARLIYPDSRTELKVAKDLPSKKDVSPYLVTREQK